MVTAPLRRLPSSPTLLAMGAAVLLIAGIVFAPGTGAVEAVGVFGGIRAPGEVGLVAAHRGDSESAPENTLPAVAAALASRAPLVEVDVQLTADGVPILMHDFLLDRTTDGTGPVWAATWDEISRLDAGAHHSPEFAGTPVPQFGQFLALLAASDKGAIVELKGSWTAEQVALVTGLIAQWGVADRLVLASFDIMTLRAAREVAPGIGRALISREVNADPTVLAELCDAIAIVTSKSFVRDDPDVVDRVHAAGLSIFVYTLNDEDWWQDAVDLGIDGIITDRPARIERWIQAATTAAS